MTNIEPFIVLINYIFFMKKWTATFVVSMVITTFVILRPDTWGQSSAIKSPITLIKLSSNLSSDTQRAVQEWQRDKEAIVNNLKMYERGIIPK